MEMQLGNYDLRSLIAARFRLPAQAGEHADVGVVARLLLIDGPGGRTLVDAGPGSPGGLGDLLAGAGIDPGSIDRVLLTHLHWDHAGGAPIGGTPVLVQAAAVEAARSEVDAGMEASRRAELERILEANIREVDGEGQILPGVRVTLSHGHTRAMQIVWVEGAGETLVATGDLIPTLSHLRLAGSGEYDSDPRLIEDEKRSLIEEALRRRAWLFLYHDMRHVAIRLGGTPERPVAVEEVRF
jgi:glyoxylase-like metal-dependent hydrolase (beta-lactamase superfamily II)